jgi:hypothetical protein
MVSTRGGKDLPIGGHAPIASLTQQSTIAFENKRGPHSIEMNSLNPVVILGGIGK